MPTASGQPRLREKVAELYETSKQYFVFSGLIVLFVLVLAVPVLHALQWFRVLGELKWITGFREFVDALSSVLIVALAAVGFDIFLSERSEVSTFAASGKSLIPKIDDVVTNSTEVTSQLNTLATTVANLVPKIDTAAALTEKLTSQVTLLREPLSVLMPEAEQLFKIPNKPEVTNQLTILVRHLNYTLFQPALIRTDWKIEINYDTRALDNDGTIAEILHWSYHLFNISGKTVEFPYTLIDVSQEPKGEVISFDIIGPPGGIIQVPLNRAPQSQRVDKYEHVYSLLPFERYTVDLRYKTTWPVNKNHPVIHNSFSPRETSFGDNTLEVSATQGNRKLKNVTIIYANDSVEPTGNRYYLTAPMLRDQAIEMILEFESTS